MLYYKTVEPATLGILKKIRSSEIFSDLRLVGGTALALQIGHRKSIDLDFFGIIEYENSEITIELEQLGNVNVIKNSKSINTYIIDNVKVDIVNYPYRWLEEANTEDNLLLARLKDIAAMKLAAITGRGTKKDFIDVYFLLQHFTLNEMLSFYEQKFPAGSTFLVLKSLMYFVDAYESELPEMLKPVNWDKVKAFIENAVEERYNNKH